MEEKVKQRGAERWNWRLVDSKKQVDNEEAMMRSWPRLAPRAMSRSMFLLQLVSVSSISVARGNAKGQADDYVLGFQQRSRRYLRALMLSGLGSCGVWWRWDRGMLT